MLAGNFLKCAVTEAILHRRSIVLIKFAKVTGKNPLTKSLVHNVRDSRLSNLSKKRLRYRCFFLWIFQNSLIKHIRATASEINILRRWSLFISPVEVRGYRKRLMTLKWVNMHFHLIIWLCFMNLWNSLVWNS